MSARSKKRSLCVSVLSKRTGCRCGGSSALASRRVPQRESTKRRETGAKARWIAACLGLYPHAPLQQLTMAIQKILVPVDYSDCAGAALAVAAEVARTFEAALDVVHVWDRPTYVSDTVRVQHPNGETRSLVEMIQENAQLEMDRFMAQSSLPAEVSVSRRLLSGNPAATILAELRTGHHDLLVVGTHGRTGFKHLLLGSVAETLVRLSPVPVLTVPGSR